MTYCQRSLWPADPKFYACIYVCVGRGPGLNGLDSTKVDKQSAVCPKSASGQLQPLLAPFSFSWRTKLSLASPWNSR